MRTLRNHSQLPRRQLPIWELWRWALGVVIHGLLSAVMVPSAVAGDLGVVIRTYDASGLSEADRTASLAAAAAILEDAGLAIARLACDGVEAAAASHACLTPLRPYELSLRLVRIPTVGPAEAGRHILRRVNPVTLGYSLVETQVRFGSLATVYVDRVAALAGVSRVDLPTLLGRAIAHEIGHLLLGTAAHARDGVMRAVWSPEALRRGTGGDWRFTPQDAEALREAARRRSAQPLHTW